MKHKKQRRRSLRRKRKKRAEAASLQADATTPRNETDAPERTRPQDAGGASGEEPDGSP